MDCNCVRGAWDRHGLGVHNGPHPHRPDVACPWSPFWPEHASPPGTRCMCSTCTPPPPHSLDCVCEACLNRLPADEASMARHYASRDEHSRDCRCWECIGGDPTRPHLTMDQLRAAEGRHDLGLRRMLATQAEDKRIADALRNYYIDHRSDVPYIDDAYAIWGDLEAIIRGEE